MAWTRWKKWTLRIFGCSTWIDTDRPGGNPILKSENGKGSFVSFRQLSSMCANPHSCQSESTLLLCLKWQLVQHSVAKCRRNKKVFPASKWRTVTKCPHKWRAVAPAADGGGCRCRTQLSPLAATSDVPERRNVTPSPAECRQVSPLRPGGLEPAAASVLEPAGRRRLRTGTCD